MKRIHITRDRRHKDALTKSMREMHGIHPIYPDEELRQPDMAKYHNIESILRRSHGGL